MNPTRKEWLDQQYVCVLQSNSSWHQRAIEAIRRQNFEQFRRQCGEWISRTRRLIADNGCGADARFTESDRLYVITTLWEQEEADPQDPYYLALKMQMKIEGMVLDKLAPAAPKFEPLFKQEYEATFETEEENTTMNKPFNTISYVYGKPVNSMVEGELIEAIKKIEGEIADLKSIKVKSTKITANIAELQAALASVVAALDAK